MSYKNIRLPKRGGGTRLQRVQVLKSGKYKFVKNKPKKSSSSKKTTKKNKSKSKKTGGTIRRMAKGLGIPSLPSMAQAGVTISWLGFRTPEGSGAPPAENLRLGRMDLAVRDILMNAKEVITTAEGWMKVIFPIAAIQLVKRVLPQAQVNILGFRWRIL